MELFASLLCMLSMVGGCYFVVMLIIRKIRKKPKSKKYSRGLLISILIFVMSIILFAVFQTPESKAKYEQQRIEAQKEKEAQEKAEQNAKEQKAQEEAEQKDKEQAEKDTKENTKEQKKDSKSKKSESKGNTKVQDTSKEDVKTPTEETLKKEIIKVVGEENLETFNYVPDNNFALIKFKGSENLSSKMTVKGMYMDISNVLKEIQKNIDVNVDFNVTYPLQDSYGNISEDIVIKASFNNETIKEINFDNFDYNNLPSIADEWWNHNALNVEN